MKIRFASVHDSAPLLEIYAQYIDTPVTFECILPTVPEFAQRIAEITKKFPYLVCEENGRIIGYAYAHRQMEREAYQWNAELSVYIDWSFTSKGAGKKLYGALIEILKEQGYKNVYGGVTLPNIKSEKLHLSLGFQCLGTYHKTGCKCGVWHDVSWFEKEIARCCSQPRPIVPINEIAKEKLESIIQKYE